MTLEIRLIGRLVSVRVVGSTGGNVRVWGDLYPGQIHTPTRLSYDQLRELGNGIHEV